VAVDKNSGNVYIAETYANHLVRVVYPSGIIETFAGIEGNSGVATSSVSATATSIGYPIGLAVDNSGNVYISDVSNAFVYEVSGGVLTYFAGNGVAGFSGDGLPATSAQISQPWGLAVDNTGIVYIGFADQGNFRVRRVLTTGNIETIAGEGNLNLPFLGAQYDDDGVLATHMQISAVSAIAVDASNNFYVADYGEDRIRKITFEATLPALPPPTINPDGGTFASGSSQTVNITDGDSTAAVYYTTDGSTPTTAATMYTGSITITGNETVKAIAVETGFSDSAIAVASFVFQAATPTFSPAAGVYTTAQTVTISDATTGSTIYYTTDGSTPTTASTQYTGTITVSASETVNAIAVATGYATSAVGSAMYQIDVNGTAPTPVISPVSGTYDTNQAITITDASPGATIYYTTDGSTPTTSSSIYPGPFMLPAGSYTVTAIAGGAGYASSATVSATYTFVTPGNVITIAGTGSQGYDGEGTATSVELNSPYAVVVDAYGNVIFADFGNQRVRKVTPSGIISTIAGNGTAGYNGDGIAATSAELNNPDAVAVDLSGNIYIADSGNNRIRMIAPNGIISTVAGTGASGYGGDGGAATSAILNQPSGVAVDSSGNLYLSDTANQIVRMVSGGVITTVAGIQGTPGTNCCNLPATATELNIPQGLAVDSSGNIYVADFGDSTIREFTVGGNMTTIAGTGTTGYNGDGIAAIAAELNQPTAVAVDMYGNVYVADEDNNRIREFSPGGPISTVAGNGTQGYNGTNMPATGTELYVPSGVFVDSNGNIFIADFGNNLVREVVQ
jgi:sugar lactone lactonase YvrE